MLYGTLQKYFAIIQLVHALQYYDLQEMSEMET